MLVGQGSAGVGLLDPVGVFIRLQIFHVFSGIFQTGCAGVIFLHWINVNVHGVVLELTGYIGLCVRMPTLAGHRVLRLGALRGHCHVVPGCADSCQPVRICAGQC